MNDSLRRLNSDQVIEVLSHSESATAIYTGIELIIEMANDSMIAYWGNDRTVIGKRFEEAVPELIGQPFFHLLRAVWTTGETYQAVDTPAQLRINGVLKTSYFDFTYRAIKNTRGETYRILHTASDVTERFMNRNFIADGLLREQALNEELATFNEELLSINEELRASEEDLFALNKELEQRVSARTSELAAAQHEAELQRDGLNVFLCKHPRAFVYSTGLNLNLNWLTLPTSNFSPADLYCIDNS